MNLQTSQPDPDEFVPYDGYTDTDFVCGHPASLDFDHQTTAESLQSPEHVQ